MTIVTRGFDSGVVLRLDREHGVYLPGDTLSGQFYLEGISRTELGGAELSVLWFTEGKGTSDLGIHAVWRFQPEECPLDWRWPQRFSTIIPRAPWSYEGFLIKIRWVVRLRISLRGKSDLICQVPFKVGNLPPLTVA
jgi:hypothetical protein